MKRHKQLWEKVASPDNLMEAAQDALRGKRGKRAGAAFFQIWEKEVVRLARELDEGSSWTENAFGFPPDKPLLAARIAEGKCRPRPCRAQEPPGVPAGGPVRVFRRISRRSAAVSSPMGESRGGALAFIRNHPPC